MRSVRPPIGWRCARVAGWGSNPGSHRGAERTGAQMKADVAQLEPKLKEILYHCLEEIRATKAALYLLERDDVFELVTQYGFREGLRRQLMANDDLVDRVITKRSPFFINGLGSDPRFSELLYQADTTRMLVAPIYSRGKLIGLIDMRDKAAKLPFEHTDLAAAQKITDQLLDLFAERMLFGQKTPLPNTIRTPAPQSSSAAAPQGAATAAPARAFPPEAPPLAFGPDGRSLANDAIDQAKSAIDRGLLRAPAPRVLTEEQLATMATMLPAILVLPGVALVALSSFGKIAGVQTVIARGTVTPQAMDSFEAKLRVWQRKRGEPEVSARTAVTYPLGTDGAPVDAHHLASLLTAPLHVNGVTGLVLTVALETAPDTATRARLEQLHKDLQGLGETVVAAASITSMQQRIAEKLLEPDFEHFTALADHSRRVASLAERLAQFIGFPGADIEKVRIAALLHDVGFRLLDYRALYRKKTVTLEDMKLLREHPVVGAALIAETPLGSEIANIVLAHHERPDGNGYPRGIGGEQIPIESRIIHICEAWDAMTSPDSYQMAVQPQAALQKMKRLEGSQFDAELIAKFSDLMSRS